jgi:hypothetical protein
MANAHAVPHVSDVYLSGRECGLLWRKDPEYAPGPPQAIVVANVEDFLAWGATYLPNYRPITAYFRILRDEDLHRFATSENDIALGQLASAFLGAILAECHVRNTELTNVWRPSLSDLLGTCSFVVARTFALQSADAFEYIIDRWYAASLKLGQDWRDQSQLRAGIADICRHLAMLASDEPPGRSVVADACKQILRQGHIAPHTWTMLAGPSSDVSDATEMMSLSRERRLEWLDRVIHNVATVELAQPEALPFVLGYLFSQLAPGTLEHLPLFASSAVGEPRTLLWYGVCAGLHPRSDVQNFAGGIGRRALRDIEAWEAIVDRPRGDFNADELDFLSASSVAQHRGATVVELAPRVYATFSGVGRPAMATDAIDRARLRELGVLINNAADLVFELTHRGDQRQLEFPRSRPTRKAPPKAR